MKPGGGLLRGTDSPGGGGGLLSSTTELKPGKGSGGDNKQLDPAPMASAASDLDIALL